jgi:hypothetical protein
MRERERERERETDRQTDAKKTNMGEVDESHRGSKNTREMIKKMERK